MIALEEPFVGWLKVDFNGQMGLVPRSYVKKITIFEALCDYKVFKDNLPSFQIPSDSFARVKLDVQCPLMSLTNTNQMGSVLMVL